MRPPKMRVCILSSSHLWNDQRIFHKQAISLSTAGYEVVIVAQADQPNVIDSIKVIPLKKTNNHYKRYAINVFRAFWLAMRNKAEVYHIHDPELLFIAIILRMFGRRVIYDSHEDYQEKLKSKGWKGKCLSVVWRPWEAFASFIMSHNIVADSQTFHKFPKNKTTIITNYVPLRFANNASSTIHNGPFIIIYVGSISYDRGIGKAIEALNALPFPDVEIHLAGAISDTFLADEISKHPKVFYHGHLPWLKINELLAQADIGIVLLQPISAYLYCPGENCVKLFEYMSMGLPVLISNFPKLKTFIESCGAGLAVDPTDSTAIAKAIMRLHNDPELRRVMGENGKRTVREKYCWEREEPKLLDVYRTVLATDRHQRRC
ncbi:MAG: glycosyltransferase family 4 protein [Pirellulales bacterium]|nr:glycosyltransferase family 4 protein [Pirellulales bacterium]